MTAGQEVATRKRQGRTLVTLPPQVMHAVYREMGAVTATLLKTLVLEALEKRGWNSQRIQNEYLRYAARCASKGEKNLFPGGRV